jgi:uroporphyrinogen III methyltransferase/synthase
VTVYLVGAGPGDPGLLTRRGGRLLARADVVIYDRLVHPALLDLAPPSAELIDVGKQPDDGRRGPARQDEINQLLVAHGRASTTVVRLKGGDPFLFGRGGEEVEVLTAAGIAWEVVPGVTSAFGVPAAVGIPVTHRGLSTSVTVVTGRVGDPSAPGGVDWAALARLDGTLVILMGMMTRSEIVDELARGGKALETPVALIERGTTSAQRVVRTTLGQMAEVDLGSPAVIVVGPVAALGDVPSPGPPPGPLSGRRVVVTRSGPRAHGLVAALEQAGAQVVEMPLTRQTDPGDGGVALRAAAADVAAFHWVVFTSANAVNRFMGELRDARALGTTLVAAVGPQTADALRLTGVEPDLVPAEHWAPGLIVEFPAPTDDGLPGRVLFPCADLAPSTIPDGLAEKGWQVQRVEAYRTVNLSTPEAGVLERVAVADAVTFTATSSVRAYLALRTPDGSTVPVPPHVVCIGPTTAANARQLGLSDVHEAFGASSDGMVAELIDHFAGRHGHGS